MLKLNLKILLGGLLLIIFSDIAYSQPAEKAGERIMMLKKMRLLEILNLPEQDADKFLIKYNTAENNIKEKQKAIDDAAKELEEAIKSNASDKDLNDKIKKMMSVQKDLQDAILNKFNSMKEILNTKQYAKLLLFEKRFLEKLRELMMDGPKDGNDRPFRKKRD